jgi:hypothetical protein
MPIVEGGREGGRTCSVSCTYKSMENLRMIEKQLHLGTGGHGNAPISKKPTLVCQSMEEVI